MGDARAGQDAPPCHPRRQARGPLRIENQSIPLDPMQAPPEPAPAIQQPTFPEGACRPQMSVTLASTQTRRPAREKGTNVSGSVISRVTLFPICTPGKPFLRPEAKRLGSGRQAAQGQSLGPALVHQRSTKPPPTHVATRLRFLDPTWKVGINSCAVGINLQRRPGAGGRQRRLGARGRECELHSDDVACLCQ